MSATDGRLIEVLDELRAEGMSPDRITTELAARYGVFVTGPTIKAWCDRYLKDAAPEAS